MRTFVGLLTFLLMGCGNGLCLNMADCFSTSVGPAVLSISGADLNFGEKSFGYTHEKILNVSNTGDFIATDIDAVSLSAPFGFQGGSFPGTAGTCASTLASGASCTLVLTFQSAPPSGPFAQTATLRYFNGVEAIEVPFEVKAESGNGILTKSMGADLAVTTVEPTSDGVIAVGNFLNMNGYSYPRVARFYADGTLSTDLRSGALPNAATTTAIEAPGGTGKYYIGGTFATIAGTAASRIARLNADGSVDTSFVYGTGFNFDVERIRAAGDGTNDIYVSGSFTTYKGAPAVRIIRLHDDGTPDAGFVSGTGFNTVPKFLWPYPDGRLLIAGAGMTTYNASPCATSCRLNSDGSLDATYNSGAGPDSSITAGFMDSNGQIYLGGYFSNYNGTAAANVARINQNGSLDASFNVGTGAAGGTPFMLGQTNDGTGDVLVAGTFTSFNGLASGTFIRLKNDGSRASGWHPDTATLPILAPLASLPMPGGKHFLATGAHYYNGASANRIARINSDGSIDPTFYTGGGGNLAVNAIAFTNDGSGDLLIAGAFFTYGGHRAGRFVRIRTDGQLDPGFDTTVTGAGNTLFDVEAAIDGSGKYYITGWTTAWGSHFQTYLFRVNRDGTPDTSFVIPGGAGNLIYTVAPLADGKAFIGGDFTNYDGTGRNRFIRVNVNGSVDATFNVGTAFNATVRNLFLAADGSGDVIAVGSFATYKGAPQAHLARIGTNGNAVGGFSSGAGFSVAPVWVAQNTDGKMVGVGNFATYNGTACTRVVGINSDGSVNAAFVTGTGFDVAPTSVDFIPDGSGDVYVGGPFTTYNGTPVGQVVRLKSDGSLDPTFNAGGVPAGSSIATLKAANDGSREVYVGGNFYNFAGVTSFMLVRLKSDGSPDVE